MAVKFIKSVFTPEDLPSDGLPEIALFGRSNVGKSSLINTLADRKEIARTSSTPGKTQCLNYYLFDNFYLVDMPGYGYARASKTSRFQWIGLIERYFETRNELRAVGILIDARHIGLANDVVLMQWLAEQEHPWFIVLTKIDKVKQQDLAAHEKYLKQEFRQAQVVFKTSSKDGKGVRTLLHFIKERVADRLDATSG
ncbi:MAG: ribosome biogenesis GTP-binding protein YihA/YsxC [Bacteroidota bacterium]|nr:ribosome biogenesis GTP-binding protein YihA/YsxC [Bacteroidota bacterium]MDP4231296.1 ribosome biogenesis GTP-binding protein YihA/YsxC [Bacteroidota bacterium]MDP4235473.1 ribosome biogenesis GTP-binding protein YihA/YsxC [Bacteroidota bacterium]